MTLFTDDDSDDCYGLAVAQSPPPPSLFHYLICLSCNHCSIITWCNLPAAIPHDNVKMSWQSYQPVEVQNSVHKGNNYQPFSRTKGKPAGDWFKCVTKLSRTLTCLQCIEKPCLFSPDLWLCSTNILPFMAVSHQIMVACWFLELSHCYLLPIWSSSTSAKI
jgi:hypothetical protein